MGTHKQRTQLPLLHPHAFQLLDFGQIPIRAMTIFHEPEVKGTKQAHPPTNNNKQVHKQQANQQATTSNTCNTPTKNNNKQVNKQANKSTNNKSRIARCALGALFPGLAPVGPMLNIDHGLGNDAHRGGEGGHHADLV